MPKLTKRNNKKRKRKQTRCKRGGATEYFSDFDLGKKGDEGEEGPKPFWQRGTLVGPGKVYNPEVKTDPSTLEVVSKYRKGLRDHKKIDKPARMSPEEWKEMKKHNSESARDQRDMDMLARLEANCEQFGTEYQQNKCKSFIRTNRTLDDRIAARGSAKIELTDIEEFLNNEERLKNAKDLLRKRLEKMKDENLQTMLNEEPINELSSFSRFTDLEGKNLPKPIKLFNVDNFVTTVMDIIDQITADMFNQAYMSSHGQGKAELYYISKNVHADHDLALADAEALHIQSVKQIAGLLYELETKDSIRYPEGGDENGQAEWNFLKDRLPIVKTPWWANHLKELRERYEKVGRVIEANTQKNIEKIKGFLEDMKNAFIKMTTTPREQSGEAVKETRSEAFARSKEARKDLNEAVKELEDLEEEEKKNVVTCYRLVYMYKQQKKVWREAMGVPENFLNGFVSNETGFKRESSNEEISRSVSLDDPLPLFERCGEGGKRGEVWYNFKLDEYVNRLNKTIDDLTKDKTDVEAQKFLSSTDGQQALADKMCNYVDEYLSDTNLDTEEKSAMENEKLTPNQEEATKEANVAATQGNAVLQKLIADMREAKKKREEAEEKKIEEKSTSFLNLLQRTKGGSKRRRRHNKNHTKKGKKKKTKRKNRHHKAKKTKKH